MLPTTVASLATPALRFFRSGPTEFSPAQIPPHISKTQDASAQITPFVVPRVYARGADQAVLISDNTTLTPTSILVRPGQPLYGGDPICGFWQDREDKNFIQVAYTCNLYSCGTDGSRFGCIDGRGHYGDSTACANIDWDGKTDAQKPGWGTMTCEKFTSATAWSVCQTMYLSGRTSYRCADHTQSSNIWLFGAEEVWLAFSGYTLTYTSTYYRYPEFIPDGYVPQDPQTTLPYAMPSGAADQMLAAAGLDLSGCMASVYTACDGWSALALEVWEGRVDKDDVCNLVANSSCPKLCNSGTESIDRLDWTLSRCASETTNETAYASHWVDYEMVAELALESLFPWEWRLQYNASRIDEHIRPEHPPSCPTVGSQLIGFAVTNIVVLALSLIVGHRRVVKAITCGCMGKKGSKIWPVMIAVGVALNIAANFINALLTRRTPGFDQLSIRQLLLLWSSRPRASWLIILIAIYDNGRKIYTSAAVAALGTEMALQAMGSYYLGRTVNYGRISGFYKRHRLDRVPHGQDALIMYAGAMLWTITVGFAFLYALWTLTPVGRVIMAWLDPIWAKLTKPFAAKTEPGSLVSPGEDAPFKEETRDYINYAADRTQNNSESRRLRISEDHDSIDEIHYRLRPGYFRTQRGSNASKLLEGGKLQGSQISVQALPRSKRGSLSEHHRDDPLLDFEEDMGFRSNLRTSFRRIVLLMILPWIGQWLFWAGFLRTADTQFCPPKLWTNVGIWALFSIVSNFFGASS